MTSSEKDYCTMLDKLIDVKGTRDLLILLHELCITSLLSSTMGKRTFLLPPKSALVKLNKAKKSDAKEQIRRHILNKLVDHDSFKAGEDTINVGTMIKNNRYNVKKGKKDEIIVDGVSCKLVARASNGIIYQADDVLQEHIVEPSGSKGRASGRRSKKRSSRSSRSSSRSSSRGSSRGSSRSRSRSRSRKTRVRRRKQTGGGDFFPLVQNNYKHEHDGSLESRLLFIQQYQDTFKNNWAPYGLGHLMLYLNQNVGDLKTQYIPFLGSDPTTSLELLLGLYEKPWNSSRLLISENQFSGFANSPMFLSGEQALMMEARELLDSIYSSSGMGSCAYESPSVDLGFINNSRNYLSNLIKKNPANIGENIESIYKIMVGEPNRFNPGHMRVFQKVWEQPELGLLKNDLIRFSGNLYDMSVPYEKRYGEMSSLFGGNARDVINRIVNNDILNKYSGMPSHRSGSGFYNLDLGGLGQSTDYESLLDYIGLWVDSDQFAHSFQIDMSKQGGIDNLFGGISPLGMGSSPFGSSMGLSPYGSSPFGPRRGNFHMNNLLPKTSTSIYSSSTTIPLIGARSLTGNI